MERRKRPAWEPMPGEYAAYSGKSGRLLRAGELVEVVAEASGRRTVVRAIGYSGRPVQFPVLTRNLCRPQPQLF